MPNCVKCKSAEATVCIRYTDYCHDCFMESVMHKFRSSIGKMQSLLSRRGCSAIVAYSGGQASRALIQLAYEFCFNVTDPNRRRFGHLIVVHVDCAALEDQQSPMDGWQDEVKNQYNLMELLNIPIESLFGDDKEQLQAAFQSIKTVEAKQEMRRQLIQQCLIEVAKNHQCPVVFVGETSTRVAIKSLAMTSQGRGFTLPLHTAAEVQIDSDVFLLRPLREHLQKEIKLYNDSLGLKCHGENGWPVDATHRNSVNNLTERFIVDLDEEFSSTVSTIVRTVGKLQFLGNAPRENGETLIDRRCVMCDEKIQTDADTWKAGNTLYTLADSGRSPSSKPIVPIHMLCYSCQNVTDAMQSPDVLPLFMQQRLNGSNIRAEIGEFLLDENEGIK